MINIDLNEKVTVVIRSAGERTEQLCRSLVLGQGISTENIKIIKEVPFSAAMRKGFKIGIERGRPWTFHLDADVLLRPGSISQMLAFAEQQVENVCQIQGKVIDKFFGGPRDAGNRLYRTSLLPKVLSCIPEEGVDIRPEAHTLRKLMQKGHPTIIIPYIVGLHDFEQYYKDIYRKCFVQGHKHAYLTELFLSIWRAVATDDRDYQVALKGFGAGIEHFGQVFIDSQQKNYHDGFVRLQMEEKADLPVESYSLDDIETIVVNWIDHEVYGKFFPTRSGLNPKKPISPSLRNNLWELYRTVGLLRIMPYLFGVFLFKTGKRIKAWAEKHST